MNTQPGKKEGVTWTKEEKVKDFGELESLLMARLDGKLVGVNIENVEPRISEICTKYGLQEPDLSDEKASRALKEKARFMIEELQGEPEHG